MSNDTFLQTWARAQNALAGACARLDDHRRDERGEGVISAAISSTRLTYLSCDAPCTPGSAATEGAKALA